MIRKRFLAAAAILVLSLAVSPAAHASPRYQASIEPTVQRMVTGAALLVHVHVLCPAGLPIGTSTPSVVRVDQTTGPSAVQHDSETFAVKCDGQSHEYAVPILIPYFTNDDLFDDNNLSPRGWRVGPAVVRIEDLVGSDPTVFAATVVQISNGPDFAHSASAVTIAPSFRLVAAGAGLTGQISLICPAGKSGFFTAALSQAINPRVGQLGSAGESFTCTGTAQKVPTTFAAGEMGVTWRAKPAFLIAQFCRELDLSTCSVSWRAVNVRNPSH